MCSYINCTKSTGPVEYFERMRFWKRFWIKSYTKEKTLINDFDLELKTKYKDD